ncbi:hypothetical protein Tco_1543293, partial [Tanacetum coccineum]
VWNACKPSNDDPEQPNHEMDVLAGHENDVNYVQFSGCAVASKISSSDASKEENLPKFKNTWCLSIFFTILHSCYIKYSISIMT